MRRVKEMPLKKGETWEERVARAKEDVARQVRGESVEQMPARSAEDAEAVRKMWKMMAEILKRKQL